MSTIIIFNQRSKTETLKIGNMPYAVLFKERESIEKSFLKIFTGINCQNPQKVSSILSKDNVTHLVKFLLSGNCRNIYSKLKDENDFSNLEALFENIKLCILTISSLEKTETVNNIIKSIEKNKLEISNHLDEIDSEEDSDEDSDEEDDETISGSKYFNSLLSKLGESFLIENEEVDDTVIANFSRVQVKKFSSADYINSDISSKFDNVFLDPILPFSSKGIPAFLRACNNLGNKIDTCAIIGNFDDLLLKFKNALLYFVSSFKFKTLVSKINDDEKRISKLKKDFSKKKNKGDSEMLKLKITSSDIPMPDSFFNIGKNNYDIIEGNSVAIRFIEFAYDFYKLYSSNVDNIKGEGIGKIIYKLYTYINEFDSNIITEMKTRTFIYSDKQFILVKENSDDIVFSQQLSKTIVDLFSMDEKNTFDRFKVNYDFVQVSTLTNRKPYWWQAKCIDYSKNEESFLNIGPTSGGKTYGSQISMSMLATSRKTRMNKLIVYSAPNSVLAIQTFCGMYVSIPGIQHKIALICDCSVYIPKGAEIFIGTPKKLFDYFKKINRDVAITKTKNYNEILPEAVVKNSITKVGVLIIDEIHTISPEYNPTPEGLITSKSTEDLLDMVKIEDGDTELPIIIGLSATLEPNSTEDLIELIKQKTNIREIKTVRYNYSDIGSLVEPSQEELDSRLSNFKLPQIKMPLCVKNGDLIEAHSESDLSSKIDLTPQIIEELMHKAKIEKVLPIPLFFDTETDAIASYKNYISYVTKRIERSSWYSAKRLYYEEMENSGSNYDKIKKLQVERLISIILSYKNNIIEQETSKVPEEELNELLDFFKSKTNNEFENLDFTPTIDLYAFLVEYKEHKTNPISSLYRSKIHPFYNFVNTGYSTNIDQGDNSDFNTLLDSQGIGSKSGSGNSLLRVMTDGLKLGIGLITASLPLGFQLENTRIINNLKKNEDKMQVAFEFCDSSVAQGIDLPYNGVAILQNDLRQISASSFLQKNGRGGRTNQNGVTKRAVTFLINVSNALDNISTERLAFNFDEKHLTYYTVDNIAECLSLLVQESEIIQKNPSSFHINTFDSDAMFPGVERMKTLTEKINLIKEELCELHEICKEICPKTAKNHIEKIFALIQEKGYIFTMSSAI